MGDTVSYVQTATVNGAGSALEIIYTHNPYGKPSRIGLIALSITAGTKTGRSCIFYGNDPTNMVCLQTHEHTATAYSNTYEPDIVIQPGQVIKFYLQNATAGDTVVVMIEGH